MDESTKERMRTRTGGRTDAGMDEWVSEGTNERTNEWMNEWMKRRTDRQKIIMPLFITFGDKNYGNITIKFKTLHIIYTYQIRLSLAPG